MTVTSKESVASYLFRVATNAGVSVLGGVLSWSIVNYFAPPGSGVALLLGVSTVLGLTTPEVIKQIGHDLRAAKAGRPMGTEFDRDEATADLPTEEVQIVHRPNVSGPSERTASSVSDTYCEACGTPTPHRVVPAPAAVVPVTTYVDDEQDHDGHTGMSPR